MIGANGKVNKAVMYKYCSAYLCNGGLFYELKMDIRSKAVSNPSNNNNNPNPNPTDPKMPVTKKVVPNDIISP